MNEWVKTLNRLSLPERVRQLPEGVTVSLIYIFFLAGALWNSLGLMQDVMYPTTPFVLGIAALAAVWLTYEYSSKLLWTLGVIFIGTWAVEVLGVATTFPFGSFSYTDQLGWQVLGVSIVVPFIWVLVIATSDAAVGHFFGRLSCVLTAIFATILNFFLEFAASALDLWQWSTRFPPISNYASWFVISLTAVLLLRDNSDRKILLKLPAHLYIALLLYFSITFFGVKSGFLRLLSLYQQSPLPHLCVSMR
ncbi:MAG: carotenoid biosynthesis protein [Bacteroidota bacterium]